VSLRPRGRRDRARGRRGQGTRSVVQTRGPGLLWGLYASRQDPPLSFTLLNGTVRVR
jgi:hypothetical protein